TLHFRTNHTGTVTVELFDSMGAKAGELINGVYQPGEHRVAVSLGHLPAGTYVYRMRTGFYRESKKLVIIKQRHDSIVTHRPDVRVPDDCFQPARREKKKEPCLLHDEGSEAA